jgi:hypothetical protein
MPAVKKHYSLDPDNTPGDLLHFFDKSHAQAHTGSASLQGVIIIHRDMNDRYLFGRSAQKYYDADGRFSGAVAIEGEKSLRLMVADAHLETRGGFFDSRMAELFERVEDSFAHTVLARIEEQEILQFRFALDRNSRGKNQVHARFFDWTRV